MPTTQHLEAWALQNFPNVKGGDDLATLIWAALHDNRLTLQPNDVLVIASKVVSKAENRWVDLSTVTPSARAEELAAITHKDPRFVELVLRESVAISRARPHVLIVQHRLGWVSANAGIDQSNVGENGEGKVLLLPQNPDASAQHLREALEKHSGCSIGVVITDTHGRPFRMGNVNIALGASGLPTLIDQRGEKDRYGRVLQATLTGYADQVAAAAGLLMGEANEGQPIILIRGLNLNRPYGTGRDLIRPAEQDLYVFSKETS
ncbi:MAG: coenzyme F420-0:L-glutamate ligase [Phototrophicales bacterium]|nr:MAG: coenzyme F420-0:L-glutamate ligase [Phototrophicales bacterium]